MKEAQVYIVATPIGNKADFSIRAVDVLKSVDLIACEDTRTSAKLLEAYAIPTKLVSYHKFNEKQRTAQILKMLEAGQKIALISDAGTPCISDPGRVLVEELFKCAPKIKITSIPGASAVTTFLSMVPRTSEEFAFGGFVPRVKGQQAKLFEKFEKLDTVFYESANRLVETLENITELRGEGAEIAVGRELTKMFEEVKHGSVRGVIDYYKTNILKGEIAFLLYAKPCEDEDEAEILDKIKKLKTLNFSDKDISAILAELYGLNKNKVYKLTILSQSK